MELVVSTQDLEPLPKPQSAPFIFNNEGLLTSAYKEKIQSNFFQSNPKSIFGTKQRVKSQLYKSPIAIDVVLKLTVFVIAIVAVIN
ncbi:MAG: hypothetical protein KC469_08975 [Flavobacteriaceae bacterium]|nr:hypothetical protein [Flavobacteriaceae bacterium]